MKLETKHTIVARYLAMGHALEDICIAYNLDYSNWKKIVQQAIFIDEVHRLKEKIEDHIAEDVAEDPIRLELSLIAKQAVKRLKIEMDSHELDSNANSRVRAANSVLDRAGYGIKKTEEPAPVINITISERQAALLNKVN